MVKARAVDGSGNLGPVSIASYTLTGKIAAGGAHALALGADGSFISWGNQASGRLGNGKTAAGSVSNPVMTTSSSAPFNGAISDVSAGYLHSVVVDTSGHAWAFGDDSYSELGNNSATNTGTPAHVLKSSAATDYLPNVLQVSAGFYFSLAVDASGTAWSWGAQGQGRLGNGSTSTTVNQKWATPVTISSTANLTGITRVAAGRAFGLALDNSANVWAWGDNTYGNLGNGSTTGNSRAAYVKLNSTTNLSGAVGIAAGYLHAAVVRPDGTNNGTVWCFGSRTHGRLGDNGAITGNQAYPVEVVTSTGAPLSNIVQISAGVAHTLALDSNHNVWAWGLNADGNLGDGTTTDRAYAVEVIDGSVNPIAYVAAGGFDDGTTVHSFSLAIAANGEVFGWGFEGSGELGNLTASAASLKSPRLSTPFDTGWFSEFNTYFSSLACTNNVYYEPASVTLNFAGYVTRLPTNVNFYANGRYIGQTSAASGAFTWNGAGAGDYQIVADGYDGYGGYGTTSVSMTVLRAQVAALSGGAYAAPANVVLTASLNGTPNRVDFYNGATLLGSSTASPWSFTVPNLSVGTYSFSADAVDSLGGTAAATTTVAVKQAIVTSVPPAMYHVPAGKEALANATLTCTYQGAPSSVTYTADGTTLGTVTQAPFTFSWTNVPLGKHTVTASSPDGLGGTTSATSSILVLPADAATVAARYSRGTGDPACISSVIAIDQETGILLDPMGANSEKFSTTPWFLNTNLIQPAYQVQITGGAYQGYPLEFENPLVAFGADAGGSALYTNQSYSFAVVSGGQYATSGNNQILISVFDPSVSVNGKPYNVQNQYLTVPTPGTAAWDTFAQNGYVAELDLSSASYNGAPISFKTRVQLVPEGPVSEGWGQTLFYPMILTHSCGRSDLGYVVSYGGVTDDSHGNPYWMAVSTPPSQLTGMNSVSYSLAFTARPPWRSSYIDQPSFAGTPMPSSYQGASVDELLNNAPPVQSSFPAPGSGQFLDLDDSPELRRHPILDQFVTDMGSDPVGLINYVLNEIELTDAIGYDGDTTATLSQASIVPPGLNRGALAVLQEGQGSAVEQCALLVYLLRQSNVPAAYVFGQTNGLLLFDEQLSKLLHMQLRGAVDDLGNSGVPQLIPVNYPWVAAYINGQWVNIFPWLKDTAVEEGNDLFGYLPEGYNTGLQWLTHYLLDDPAIRSFQSPANNPFLPPPSGPVTALAQEYDNPGVLFPEFVKLCLQQSSPNVSIDDIGVTIYNRRNYFTDLTKLPRPWQTPAVGAGNLLDTLSSPPNTGTPDTRNIFDTIEVQLYSDRNNNGIYEAGTDGPMLDTGAMRACDLHNRRFLIYHTKTGTNTHNMIVSLEPFSTGHTSPNCTFDNDPTLLNQQTLSAGLVSQDDNLQMQITSQRHRYLNGAYTYDASATPDHWTPFLGFSEVTSSVETRPLRKGDLAALCLNFGRVTHTMLDAQANKYWLAQQQQLQNPQAAVSIETAYGLPAYLMGMSYYCNVGAFEDTVSNLTKSVPLSFSAHGLAKLTPLRDYTGLLPNSGQITLNYPRVDMFFTRTAWASNSTIHPNSGDEDILQGEDWGALLIGEISAQEHRVINKFFQQSGAVSTVKLLDTAQGNTPGSGVVQLSNDTASSPDTYFLDKGNTNYGFPAQTLAHWAGDLEATAGSNPTPGSMWYTIYQYLNPAGNVFNRVLITPGAQSGAYNPKTKTYDYTGMAAFLLGPGSFAALIDQENGGDGSGFDGFTSISYDANGNLTTPASINYNQLVLNEDGSLSIQGSDFSGGEHPIAPITPQNFSDTFGSISGGTTLIDQQTATTTNTAISILGLSLGPIGAGTGTNADATAISQAQNSGATVIASPAILAGTQSTTTGVGTSAYGAISNFFADPVNSITGEFYIDAVDLRLNGPMPLEIRRNYSSSVMSDSNFGFGWRLAYFPYLVVSGDANASLIYAAEPDGTTIAYRRQPSPNTNLYIPTFADNPLLQNLAGDKAGSVFNLFNNTLTTDGAGNYTLNEVDGSVRSFATTSFATSGPNGLTRQRPYLQKWTDNRGNSYAFTFGTDNTQVNYGQLTRIVSTNGDFVGFEYNAAGHITQAFTGDGRRLYYTYDDYGDLVQVQLPDGAIYKYTYQHQPQTGVSGFYSQHLIIEEDKPEGRILQNTYDSWRRVVTQSATEATKVPIQTASFQYYNAQWTNGQVSGYVTTPTAASDGTITGYTILTDVNNNTTTYTYANSEQTQTVDQMGQTTTQLWCQPGDGPGSYQRSIRYRCDQRGLQTDFTYDISGNVISKTVSGDIRGSGLSESAITSCLYNGQNLITQVTDPVGIVTKTYYDSTYTYLPWTVVVSTSSGAVTTTQYTYGSMVGNNGAGAYGLLTKVVQALGTSDQAETDMSYNLNGFLTSRTILTGTSDPNVVVTYGTNMRGEIVSETDSAGRNTYSAYDGCGRCTSKQRYDANGSLVWWEYYYYNQNGELSWIDGPRYNPEDYIYYQYDGAGRRSQEIHWRSQGNPNGAGVQAIAGVDAAYATTFYQHDSFGNLVEVDDPRYYALVMTYDSIGQLIGRDWHNGDNTTPVEQSERYDYSYGQTNLTTTVTNGVKGRTTTVYTQNGLVESRQKPDGSATSVRYDFDGRVVTEKLSNGDYWSIAYDDFNRTVTRSFCPVSLNGTALCSEVTAYDRRGNAISQTDVDGNTSLRTYDGLNRVKTFTGPPGQMVRGGVQSQTVQRSLTYTYDAAGITTSVANSLGDTTTTTLDAVGRPVLVAVTNGGTLIHQTSYSYSPDWNAVTQTVGTGAAAVSTTTFSDTFGKPVLTINGDGTYRLTTYDAAENVLSSDNEHGDTTLYSYGVLNRVATQQLPTNGANPGATTFYYYDEAGNFKGRQVPGGAWDWADYDSACRKTDETIGYSQNGNGVTPAFKYHTFGYYTSGPYIGTLQTVSDQRGVTKTIVYDDFFRPKSVTTSGGTGVQNQAINYTYKNSGVLTDAKLSYTDGVSGPAVEVSRSINDYEDIYSESTMINGLATGTIQQSWDGAGRRSAEAFVAAREGVGAGSSYSFSYQADGLMTQVTNSGPNSSQNFNFAYSTNGLLSSRTNPWRTLNVSSRDLLGRITAQSDIVGSATPLSEMQNWRPDPKLASYSATRIGSGVWSETRPYVTYNGQGQETSSAYNVRGQLLSEPFAPAAGQTGAYSYQFDSGVENGPGVRTSATYTSQWKESVNTTGGENNVAQVLAETNLPGSGTTQAISWGYDLEGNVTSRTIAGGVTQTLIWDGFNRLVELKQRDQSNNGFDWFAYYDAFGRRLRTVQQPVTGGTETGVPLTIDSFYDPQVEFLELGVAVNSSSAVSGTNSGPRTWKVYGPDLNGIYGGLQGIGGLEATVDETSGTITPVINDAFGNTVASISGTSVTWNAAEVGAYGLLPGTTAFLLDGTHTPAQATVWRGHRLDPTGYYYLGARYYDPVSGRFLSPDPLGHAASSSLYDYAMDDPVNGCDPDGRCASGLSDGWSQSISANADPSSLAYSSAQTLSSVVSGIFSKETGSAIQEDVGALGTGLENGKESLTDLVCTVFTKPGQIWNGLQTSAQTIGNYYSSSDFSLSNYLSDYHDALHDTLSNSFGTQAKGFQTVGNGIFQLASAAAGNELGDTIFRAAESGALPSGWCFLPGTLVEERRGEMPIEAVQLGDRVVTSDCTHAQDSSTEVDPATWHLVRLRMPNPDGSKDELEMSFLRSDEWMASEHCEVGSEIWLQMSELGIAGWARVEAIEPCPAVEAGAGRVVTGTVTHLNGFVLRLHFAGTDETLSPTATHRLYSETRHEWVSAGELQAGEMLKTHGGTVRIASVEHLPGIHRVYNIEVETDHRYFVGNAEILSHNASGCGATQLELALGDTRSVPLGNGGALNTQYSLRAAADGFYPVMTRGAAEPTGLVWLQEGDVWKFGETINPATRYSPSFLTNTGAGLKFVPEFEGTTQEAYQLQNMKIQNYQLQNDGVLPAGNKGVQ